MEGDDFFDVHGGRSGARGVQIDLVHGQHCLTLPAGGRLVTAPVAASPAYAAMHNEGSRAPLLIVQLVSPDAGPDVAAPPDPTAFPPDTVIHTLVFSEAFALDEVEAAAAALFPVVTAALRKDSTIVLCSPSLVLLYVGMDATCGWGLPSWPSFRCFINRPPGRYLVYATGAPFMEAHKSVMSLSRASSLMACIYARSVATLSRALQARLAAL